MNNFEFKLNDFDDFEDEDLELINTLFKKTKLKKQTIYDFRKTQETRRREDIRKIVTGQKSFKQNELYCLLTVSKDPQEHLQPQDLAIDAQGNTALLVALDRYNEGDITSLLALEEVLASAVNPDIENLQGQRAIHKISEKELVRMLWDITKTKRQDIFTMKMAWEFKELYDKLNI